MIFQTSFPEMHLCVHTCENLMSDKYCQIPESESPPVTKGGD